MKLYLASVIEHYKQIEAGLMKLYLAGIVENYTKLEEKLMKLYLAGEHSVKNGSSCQHNWSDLFILESYYYARKKQVF